MNAQLNQLLEQRTSVETKLATAKGVVLEAQQKEAAYKELLTSVPELVTTSANGDTYQGIDVVQEQIAQLKAKRDQMAATYRPGSPIFDSINASLHSLEHSASQNEAAVRHRSSTSPNLVYENIKTDLMRATAEAVGAQQPAQLLSDQLDQINQRLAQLDTLRTENDNLQRTVPHSGRYLPHARHSCRGSKRGSELQCPEDFRRGGDCRAVASGPAGTASPQVDRVGNGDRRLHPGQRGSIGGGGL